MGSSGEGRSPVGRPARAGVSVERRVRGDGSTRFYARCTDPCGRRVTVPPARGRAWEDGVEAVAAACVRQDELDRLHYRSQDLATIPFGDLVVEHYLPPLIDAAPNTRENTASHLGDGSGVPARRGTTPSGRAQPAVVRLRADRDRGGRPEWGAARAEPDGRRRRRPRDDAVKRSLLGASCRSPSTRAGSTTTWWTGRYVAGDCRLGLSSGLCQTSR